IESARCWLSLRLYSRLPPCSTELRQRANLRVPAQPLRVRYPGERQVLRTRKVFLQIAVEQTELLEQGGVPALGKRLYQVFKHGSEPTRHLGIVRASQPDFVECQMNEVFPVRGANDQTQLARSIPNIIGPQMPLAHASQKTVKLIDRQNRGCRIVDRRR